MTRGYGMGHGRPCGPDKPGVMICEDCEKEVHTSALTNHYRKERMTATAKSMERQTKMWYAKDVNEALDSEIDGDYHYASERLKDRIADIFCYYHEFMFVQGGISTHDTYGYDSSPDGWQIKCPQCPRWLKGPAGLAKHYGIGIQQNTHEPRGKPHVSDD